MLEKIKFTFLLLTLLFSNSVLSSTLFIKNSLDMSGESGSEEMKAFYSINKGAWIDIEQLDMNDPSSLSNLIGYTDGDRLRIKVITPTKRFVSQGMSIPYFRNSQPHMFEIKGTTLPEEVHIQIDGVLGRGTIKRAFTTDSGWQYRVTTCGGAGIVIACAVGDYGELVMRFAGITTIPVFSGSSYIDERFFDKLEKGKQIELLDNKGHYFSGLFSHEVKIWDREAGEIFDLKAGGLGLGMGEAVSIKFTRW